MTNDEVIGTIEFSVSAGLMPWVDPSEFVHTVTGKIVGYTEMDERIEAGEIVLRVVSVVEAINRGEDLYDVCDADSALLKGIFAVLFDREGETKEEYDIQPGWSNLVFVEKVEIDPGLRQTSLAIQAIETALAMFAADGLVVAAEDWLDLGIEEWKYLGFVRIARTNLVLRDHLRRNPYEQPTAEIPIDTSYICTGCGEEIVIPIDFSQGTIQEYVEDCPVCCRANVLHVEIDDSGNATVRAEPEQDYE